MIDTEYFFNEIFIDLQRKSVVEKMNIKKELIKLKLILGDDTTDRQFSNILEFFELE